MRRNVSLLRSALVAWLLLTVVGISHVSAQTFTGGLRGTVRDANGVIPGVEITLTNEGTNAARSVVTNQVGEYSFPAIEPGTYTIGTQLVGFKTFVRKGVLFATQQFLVQNIMMEVGTVVETITVTGAAPLLEVGTASVSTVLGKELLETLPSLGGNVYLLAQFIPTLVMSGNMFWDRLQDVDGPSSISMGGGGVRDNNYLLDGISTVNWTNRTVGNPPQGALDDVRVQVHTFDGEMGRTGGGVFNASAKSGTNEFRGSGYLRFRPSDLLTQNFFLELQGVPKVPERYRVLGYGVGGPIIRNRTFFWTAAEKWFPMTVRNSSLQFPTARELRGDFSQTFDRNGRLLVIYDPLTTRTDPATGRLVRDPFPGNIIPAGRLNPVAVNMAKYLQAPDLDVSAQAPNYFGVSELVDKVLSTTVKVTHRFNDRMSLSGFWMRNRVTEPSSSGQFYRTNLFASNGNTQLERTPQIFVANYTHIVNDSTVVALRAGGTHYITNSVPTYSFERAEFNALGFNQVLLDAMRDRYTNFPNASFTGFSSIGGTSGSFTTYPSWGTNGTVSKLVNRHSLKVGGEFRVIGVDANSRPGAPSFAFTRNFTQGPNPQSPVSASGSPIADFMLGTPASGSAVWNTPSSGSVRYYGGFIQDDYRVNSKLTVNYGLRVEHETGPREAENGITIGFDRDAISPLNSLVRLPIDPLTGQARQVKGGLIYAGVNGAPTYQGNPPAVKVSPRGGIAWAIDEKNVVRGGYGMFWSPWNYGSLSRVGYSLTTFMQQDTLIPITTLDNPFPKGLDSPMGNSLGLLTGTGGDISFVDQNGANPAERVQQFAFDYQRELPGRIGVSVRYMSARGDNLALGDININQLPVEYQALGSKLVELVPNPFFGVAGAGALATRATIERGQLLRPFPQFAAVNAGWLTGGRSRYHALVLELNKRTTWWGGAFTYTFSRLNDTGGDSNVFASAGTGVMNNYDRVEPEYSRGLLDMPHKLTLAPLVRLPFGKGRTFLSNSGWLDWIVGGWTLSGVGMFQSGFPIAIYQTPNNSGLFGSGQRPNMVPGVDQLMPGDITARLTANYLDNQYLNPAAWSNAPAYTFGNAPRTDPGVRTPFRPNLDVVLSKTVRMGGNRTGEVRFEMLNATNAPKFESFNTQLGSGSFGQVRSQAGFMRIVQITTRLSF